MRGLLPIKILGLPQWQMYRVCSLYYLQGYFHPFHLQTVSSPLEFARQSCE